MTDHRFIRGDSYKELSELPANLIHGTVTSPPYFGKLDYGFADQMGMEPFPQYLDNMANVFKQVYRVTIPGGGLLLNISNTWNNYSPIRSRLSETKEATFTGSNRRPIVRSYPEKSELPVTSLLRAKLTEVGWLHRDTWIWSKGPGRPTNSDRPYQSHEYVLYFRKPDRPGRYRELYWDGSVITGTVHTYRPVSHPVHPCPFPLEMAKDYVRAIIPENGTVLDPFAGIRTVAKAAEETGRNSVSIDLKEW